MDLVLRYYSGLWGNAAGAVNNVQWMKLRDMVCCLCVCHSSSDHTDTAHACITLTKVENTLGCGLQLELVVPFKEASCSPISSTKAN